MLRSPDGVWIEARALGLGSAGFSTGWSGYRTKDYIKIGGGLSLSLSLSLSLIYITVLVSMTYFFYL